MKRWRGIPVGIAVVTLAAAVAGLHFRNQSRAAQSRVDFSRDIRPIFNQNCTSCHGGVRQKNGVSFIYREEALGKGKSGRPTIVPGHPERSELIARLISTDPEARMPYRAPPLPPHQIALLRQWIKEGATWEDYWAFVAPKRQTLPSVVLKQWPRQPLDLFILSRLEKDGLAPSPEADKATLLRRVSFDLTGLPPTPEELSSFLADKSPEAYDRQVDRLLASPSYGERWAALWLDLARYADSKGYQKDLKRTVWPYRDWVIDAFNRNMTYDQFVITQLAGDLLPHATFEDRIATAFQRLTPANDEGGTDDEEYRLIAVMDRAATVWSVLNGVTMNCVQCHSHPYDPIRHVEYYKFLAFYNNSRDSDLYDDSPVLHVPADKSRYQEADQLQREIAALRDGIVASGRQLAQTAGEWTPLPIVAAAADEALGFERRLARLKEEAQRPLESPLASVGPQSLHDLQASYAALISDASTRLAHVKSTPASALDIRNGEAWAGAKTPQLSVYKLVAKPNAGQLTALRVEVPPVAPDKARHTPEQGFIVDSIEAWLVQPDGREARINFVYFAPDSTEALRLASMGAHAPGTARLSRQFRADTKLFQSRWTVGVLAAPLQVTPGSQIKVHLTQTQTFLQEEKPAPVKRLRLSASNDPRWIDLGTAPALSQQLDALARLGQQLRGIPTVRLPVMAERADYERRQTLEFERGNFLTKVGPTLSPDVPQLFSSLPTNASRDRLTMARWFFSPGQPLTARVAVNRFWEELFGTGIVETLEDFGSVGEAPSHPHLLDWLALHFQNDLHWDMKALLRELVTSATYRQAAGVSPELLAKDPRNRLLARGPQQRLTAEMVRDQALVAGGLLTPTIGGPPVMPPQPHDVKAAIDEEKWVDATGPDRYRRAIYTYLKRTSIYPSAVTFDASTRDVSLARRIPTNTPLQALVTLNDPVYTEAAAALGRRMRAYDGHAETAFDHGPIESTPLLIARLNYGAQLVLSRNLTPSELRTFQAFCTDVERMPDARALQVSFDHVGGRAERGTARDSMMFYAVATALLNLDAALTR